MTTLPFPLFQTHLIFLHLDFPHLFPARLLLPQFLLLPFHPFVSTLLLAMCFRHVSYRNLGFSPVQIDPPREPIRYFIPRTPPIRLYTFGRPGNLLLGSNLRRRYEELVLLSHGLLLFVLLSLFHFTCFVVQVKIRWVSRQRVA